MIIRELKLKPSKVQEATLNEWLWSLTGVYNWAVRKIKQDSKDKIYYSKMDFQNLLADHGKKIGLPAHTIQGTLIQAWSAWARCFKKAAKEPKLKSVRNKLKSIPFPDPIPRTRIKSNRIGIPILGSTKFYKQDISDGKIKCARIVKKASGWYLQLTIDAKHIFRVKDTLEKVGIDTGFKHLAVLSNGVKIENQRNYIQGQERLAQAQRGKRKKLTGRLQEKIANRRKDFNHKVSRKIVEDYTEIYITKDNLRGQSNIFGKSVMDAGISQLRQFISYKSGNHGRKFGLVESSNTTRTCSSCGSLTGPTGLSGLVVRDWVCSVCGARHDRDINSGMNILNFGLGCSLVSNNVGFKQESSGGAR